MREITRDVIRFLLGFVIILVVSALLAPWLHTFLPFKFDRILRRLIMIGTLFLVWGLVRSRRESLGRLGLGWGSRSFPQFGTGFLGGALLVAAITVIQWKMGVRFWKLSGVDLWHWIGFFIKGFGAGALIAVIEEFFFRGFLFLTLKDLWNNRASLVVTNLIYALVHFFPKGHFSMGAQPTAVDSFRLLRAAVMPSPEIFLRIAPAVIGLFLFGVILSFLFLRTKSLYASIGLHAGAVFGLKLNRRFLPEISERMGLFSGTKNLYDGMAGMLTLAFFAAAAGLWARRRTSS